ncbi:MAG: response regulator [Proteobacteria bacterium]|nr:response regulator [Pseudomonadota bacterium]
MVNEFSELIPEDAQRILIVDDNPAIHDDFHKILCPDDDDRTLQALDAALFEEAPRHAGIRFVLDSVYQGQDAIGRVLDALANGRPYTLAFVDIRMPPGWNGIVTAAELLRTDPHLQVVLCTAYSDFSWEQITEKLGGTDRVLILKKPFSVIEVQQLASSLTTKWQLIQDGERHMSVLEERVAERTKELAQANIQLRQEIDHRSRVEKELRRAQRLEALGRLAAGIGHEINNPLNFISGAVEIIRFELDQAQVDIPEDSVLAVERALDAASIGVERIMRIVRNIKLFSRPDESPSSPLNLAEVLPLCAKMIGDGVGAAVALDMELADVPLVMGKRVELEQVFLNLLQNAAHAVVEAGVAKPKIRVSLQPEPDGYVTAEIVDNGTGIAEEVLEKVFDPFFTTKSPNRGTGLGLAICHSIVTSMDGTIELRGAEGGGTVARMRLPVVENHAEPDVDADSAASSAQRDSIARARILVVDDEPIMLEILSHALRDHEVVAVTSAREALSISQNRTFDLILCDLMMPLMSGRDFYELSARAQPGLEERIVFISGGARIREIQTFLDRVPNECLEKPFDIEVLHASIKRALDRHGPAE